MLEVNRWKSLKNSCRTIIVDKLDLVISSIENFENCSDISLAQSGGKIRWSDKNHIFINLEARSFHYSHIQEISA